MPALRRRDFITLLGGAAVAWPLAARAQQGERVRRVGIFMDLSEQDAEGQTRVTAFRKGLQDLGWTEGRNSTLAGPRVTPHSCDVMQPSLSA
jgi:putative ABC transport system substrate-binding protein